MHDDSIIAEMGLVGVIDLSDGAAVRAVAGRRERYQSVKTFRGLCGATESIDGSAEKLLRCYRDAGIHSIYVADLDAIRFGKVQRSLIDGLVTMLSRDSGSPTLFLDLGIEHELVPTDWKWLADLAARWERLMFIVASECVRGHGALRRAVDRFGQ